MKEGISHKVRTADGGTRTINRLIRSKAIKLMCMECLGWGDPKDCTSPMCPLFPFKGRTLASMKGATE